MSRIAGIIYPSAFQVTEMIGEMHATYSSQTPFQYFHHKNLELGGWDTELTTNEAKNIWALIDGEIYNKKILREELKQRGFKFRSESDGELIVHAYDAWKDEFLQKLNGPFALAIFDEENEILLLARDRFGQKPLYWTAQGEYWLFSTEIKGLIATGVVPQTPSTDALASYLYFGFIPQDLSAIHGVNKLLPCHYLKVNLNRQTLIAQHWSFSDHLQNKAPLSKEELLDQLGKLLEEAVRSSFPKEGMVAAFLEGNLGSSVMTWFLEHTAPRDRIRTFSAGFEEPHPVELEISSEVARTFSLPYEQKRIQPEEVINELPKIVWYLDEPLADPFVLQTWHLGKLASPHCRFAYADLGWEEMFGGSSRYFTENERSHPKPPLAFFLARLPKKLRHRFLFPFLKLLHSNYHYRILRNIDINRAQVSYLMNAALFKGRGRKKVSPNLFHDFDPEVFTQRFHRLISIPGSIDPSLYYDAKTELPDCSLFQYEKLLTPHNIQVINPFLDPHLVEFLAHIPEEIKFETKAPGALLYQLMDKLSHQCSPFQERKDSFMDTWRSNPRFRNIFSLLLKGRLVDEGLISGRWIRQQLSYPYLAPIAFHQLWSILVLEVWFRLFINRPIDRKNTDLSLEDLLRQ